MTDNMGVSPDGAGLSPAVEPASSLDGSATSIPDAGARSLVTLGLSHYYDAEDWEATYSADDLEYAGDWLSETGGWGNGVYEVATLIQGPTLFAGHYPIGWVEGSDPADIDDWEVRFFRSYDHWQGAVAQAIEARRAATLGAVHESAVGNADAPEGGQP